MGKKGCNQFLFLLVLQTSCLFGLDLPCFHEHTDLTLVGFVSVFSHCSTELAFSSTVARQVGLTAVQGEMCAVFLCLRITSCAPL